MPCCTRYKTRGQHRGIRRADLLPLLDQLSPDRSHASFAGSATSA